MWLITNCLHNCKDHRSYRSCTTVCRYMSCNLTNTGQELHMIPLTCSAPSNLKTRSSDVSIKTGHAMIRVLEILQSQSRSFEIMPLTKVCVCVCKFLYNIPLYLCSYLAPFLRYSASNNGIILICGIGVVEGHWKWSNMTVGQSSLIYLAHHCYDWHPGSRCG